MPQIAIVVWMDELNVTVQWWMGSFSDTWREWKERNVVVKEKFPRNAIIKNGITFTASKRLTRVLLHTYTHTCACTHTTVCRLQLWSTWSVLVVVHVYSL